MGSSYRIPQAVFSLTKKMVHLYRSMRPRPIHSLRQTSSSGPRSSGQNRGSQSMGVAPCGFLCPSKVVPAYLNLVEDDAPLSVVGRTKIGMIDLSGTTDTRRHNGTPSKRTSRKNRPKIYMCARGWRGLGNEAI